MQGSWPSPDCCRFQPDWIRGISPWDTVSPSRTVPRPVWHPFPCGAGSGTGKFTDTLWQPADPCYHHPGPGLEDERYLWCLPESRKFTPETKKILWICRKFKREILRSVELPDRAYLHGSSTRKILDYIDPLCPLAWRVEDPDGKGTAPPAIHHVWNLFDFRMRNFNHSQPLLRALPGIPCLQDFQKKLQIQNVTDAQGVSIGFRHPLAGWSRVHEDLQGRYNPVSNRKREQEVYQVPPWGTADHARAILENILAQDWPVEDRNSLAVPETFEKYVLTLHQALCQFACSVLGSQEILDICSRNPEIDTDRCGRFLKENPGHLPLGQAWPALLDLLVPETDHRIDPESPYPSAAEEYVPKEFSSTWKSCGRWTQSGRRVLDQLDSELLRGLGEFPSRSRQEVLALLFGVHSQNHSESRMDALARKLPVANPNSLWKVQKSRPAGKDRLSRVQKGIQQNLPLDPAMLEKIYRPGNSLQGELLSLERDQMPANRNEWDAFRTLLLIDPPFLEIDGNHRQCKSESPALGRIYRPGPGWRLSQEERPPDWKIFESWSMRPATGSWPRPGPVSICRRTPST